MSGGVERRLADLVVGVIGIEAALEHRLESTRVPTLRGSIEGSVVLRSDLTRELWIGGDHRLRGGPIAAAARRHEAVDVGELRGRAVLGEVACHTVVAGE